MLKSLIKPLIAVPPQTIVRPTFMASVVASSLIDSVTITSGTVNIYGNIYSGYGGVPSGYAGSKSPSTIDLADEATHTLEALRQHNNQVEFTLGANSAQYAASLNPSGGVTNSDADAFKTVKFYNTSSNALVLTLERADIPYSPYSKYGYFDGSSQSLVYPRWKQTTGEAGDYFVNQTIRVELWS